MNQPTGTITFLFTDIEGSTRLWENYPIEMGAALARHDALMRVVIENANGYIFKTVGDAFCAAFDRAPDALNAAMAAQLALFAQEWPEEITISVRMALHTGAAETRESDYFGPTLNRVARLLAIGHGGQILLSEIANDLCRDSLELGCSLSSLGEHRLKDLGRPSPVYQLLHPELPSDFPPLRSLSNPDLRHNLPLQLTSFVGREMELAQVRALLGKTRLLTLTGSGGCGKTRLALQAAAELLDGSGKGEWLVELAPLAEPELLPQTVATVLGLKEEQGKTLTQTLMDHLINKQVLIVLDNCEHLLGACAQLADTLLRHCPRVQILATSREGLGIAGELTYRVPSLSSPDPNRNITAESLSQFDSVQLFIERALFHQPAFVLTNRNAPALASVCFRLDGIPLAIELAAARVRSISVEDINSKLDQRFRLLTGGSRTALPRQQTLRSLIDWSYDLLNEPERALLCRLSVFAGGWDLESAEAVCSGFGTEAWAMLDLLTSLDDKSLIAADQNDGSTRYRLLETVRQYARDRLVESGENEAVRKRHREYFLELAEGTAPKLVGSEQAHWLQLLEDEHENLRAALEWSVQKVEFRTAVEEQEGAPSESTFALRFCGALDRYWSVRGHLSEGLDWCERALSTARDIKRNRERAKALDCAGVLAGKQGSHQAARNYHEESIAISKETGDQKGIADSLLNLGSTAHAQGDLASARTYYEESLSIHKLVGDRNGIAHSLNNLGSTAHAQGDLTTAMANYEESMSIWKEIGDRNSIADSLNNLGKLAVDQSEYVLASTYFEQSLTIRREIGNRKGIAGSLNSLGILAYKNGRYAIARAYHEESMAILRDIGDRSGIASSLSHLGTLAYVECDYTLVRAYIDEGLAIYREIGERSGIAGSLTVLGSVANDQCDYVSARAYHEESLGIYQDMGNMSGAAWSLYGLGNTASGEGDDNSARAYHNESLANRRDIGDRFGVALSLEAFANLAIRESRPARAAVLWGASESLREAIGAPLPADMREMLDQEIVATRQSLGVDAFSASWANGRAITMDQAIQLAITDAGDYV